MTPQSTSSWLDWRHWRNLIINAFVITAVLLSSSILVTIIWRHYRDRPPVLVESQDPVNLGVLCAGTMLPINNLVTIDDPVVVIYYISVMDATGITNLIGHQEIYSGFQHPTPGTFAQKIPWVVPDLDAGNYVRSFAARGTDTSEKTVFVTSTFTIEEEGEDC